MPEHEHPAAFGAEVRSSEAEARATLAQVSFLYFRHRRLCSLRRLALASLPLWVQAFRPVVPPLLTWFALVLEAYCLIEVGTYAALEHLWRRRARTVPRALPVALHRVWRPWDEMISSIWYVVGFVSLVPWVSVAEGRALWSWLGPALVRLAAAAGVLVRLALGAARFPA